VAIRSDDAASDSRPARRDPRRDAASNRAQLQTCRRPPHGGNRSGSDHPLPELPGGCAKPLPNPRPPRRRCEPGDRAARPRPACRRGRGRPASRAAPGEAESRPLGGPIGTPAGRISASGAARVTPSGSRRADHSSGSISIREGTRCRRPAWASTTRYPPWYATRRSMGGSRRSTRARWHELRGRHGAKRGRLPRARQPAGPVPDGPRVPPGAPLVPRVSRPLWRRRCRDYSLRRRRE